MNNAIKLLVKNEFTYWRKDQPKKIKVLFDGKLYTMAFDDQLEFNIKEGDKVTITFIKWRQRISVSFVANENVELVALRDPKWSYMRINTIKTDTVIIDSKAGKILTSLISGIVVVYLLILLILMILYNTLK